MAEFPATRISLIERIQQADNETRREALEAFIEAYRPALIDYLVKARKVDPDEADDIVQDFLFSKVLSGSVLAKANKQSRFRNLLRVCIRNYLLDQVKRPDRRRVSTGHEQEWPEIAEGEQCETDPLDGVWALAVFRTTLFTLKAECLHWEVFVDRKLTQPPVEYRKIVAKYGYRDPSQASNALITATKAFNRILSACVEAQNSIAEPSDSAEFTDETRLLKLLLEEQDSVRKVVELIREQPTSESVSVANTLATGSIVLVDPSADLSWGESTTDIFQHLLDQPADKLDSQLNISKAATLEDVLATKVSALDLTELLTLKSYFNARGKSGDCSLPRRVNVAMTFAIICRFVIDEGELHEITSMSASEFLLKARQLAVKSWLPEVVVKTLTEGIRKVAAA